MIEPYWQSEDGRVTLYCGDCLEVMPQLVAQTVGAVITDPPYRTNTKSDGSGKLNPWADICNAALWYKAWLGECRRLLLPMSCLWSCLSWRSFVTYQKAACDLGWPIESLLVWNKDWIGPGGNRGLRPCYELVALWAMPGFGLENRSLRDIQTFPWSSHKPHGHPAEKPVGLFRWLVDVSAPTHCVLDPFMGSGTAGVACAEARRGFIGIELNEHYCEIAKARIQHAMRQGNLFAGAADGD